ncbi:PREDICTED: sugar transport protein 3-like [Tarenaya hassleriana]|uniref:sugar transport protein 3-like n=1 Tax=Tarenaya hassleriana TaxID=28532 RepID=UPI00053CA526|nr:PREDICTED: sugar transport protein 3-like [Tarenaya hassleriana]
MDSNSPPVFDGENYQMWAVKMKAYMKGADLWEVIEEDYEVTPLGGLTDLEFLKQKFLVEFEGSLTHTEVPLILVSGQTRISSAMATVPASILILGSLFLPETPNSIIQRTGDVCHAELVLRRVWGTPDVGDEPSDLVRAGSEIKTDYADNPFVKMLQRKYRPQLVMALAIPFFQQVTGINMIAFYAPILFRTIGFSESASLRSVVVTGIVGMASMFVSMLVVDRLGPKTLFLVGGIQMLVSQVMVGIIMIAELRGQGYAYVVLVLICVYVAGFGWSWGPLGWLVPSEIFPLEIRSAAQSVTVAVSFVFTFVVAQSFLAMLCRSEAGIFFFYGGWVVVMTAAMQMFLPETKNVPMEKVAGVWEHHWFWKRFVRANDEKA